MNFTFFTKPEKDLPLDTAAELLIISCNKSFAHKILLKESFVTNLPYQYGFLTKSFV